MDRFARIYGCLLGGACGDALGSAVEFKTLDAIRARFGPEGITHFAPIYGPAGAVTDDTQMTLFTVEGLIRAAVRQSARGVCNPVGVVHHAYLRWLATQEEAFGRLGGNPDLDGWLIRDRRLWSRRAPGNTCLSSLRTNRSLGTPVVNDSKGCGTVMRDAPFGFLGEPAYCSGLAAAAARTTHGHPSATFSSAALAAIIAHIANGISLRQATATALTMLAEQPAAAEVRQTLEQALRLSEASDWRVRLGELGEGWVAEEALGIAVLCALAAETPREAIIAAVNHDGDSDSTGAITGNILGALHGAGSLPGEWVERVELRDVIETLARDFATVLDQGPDAEAMQDRYPGW